MARYLYCPSCGERVYEMTRELAKDEYIRPTDFKACRPDVEAPHMGDFRGCPLCKASWPRLPLTAIHEEDTQ